MNDKCLTISENTKNVIFIYRNDIEGKLSAMIAASEPAFKGKRFTFLPAIHGYFLEPDAKKSEKDTVYVFLNVTPTISDLRTLIKTAGVNNIFWLNNDKAEIVKDYVDILGDIVYQIQGRCYLNTLLTVCDIAYGFFVLGIPEVSSYEIARKITEVAPQMLNSLRNYHNADFYVDPEGTHTYLTLVEQNLDVYRYDRLKLVDGEYFIK